MRGVVKGNVVGLDNPTIFFTFQVEGLLTDPFSLSMQVMDATGGSPKEVIGETVLDLSDPPTGVKLGIGRFHAIIDTSTFKLGTHEIRWRHVATTGGPTILTRQRFEVLDPDCYLTDGEFVGYATTRELQNMGFNQNKGRLQELINDASHRIEELTARFFEPRFIDLRLNSRGGRRLKPGDPIIGIGTITIELTAVGGVLTQTPIDPGLFKIFNRHLEGVINPDDRDNPRIELFDVIPRRDRPAVPLGFKFMPGPLVARIPGVYGYTDPNGSPFGQEPRALARVVAIFAAENAVSPIGGGGLGGAGTTPGIIKKAKTRDQMVEFAVATSGDAAAALIGPITGNRQVDDVLLRFMRPPHYGAV